MLSFSETKDSIVIAVGYGNKDCVGRPLFKVHFVPDYSKDSTPLIASDSPTELIDNERFRLMTEYGLSRVEFQHMVAQISKDEPVDPSASRSLKRAYLDIKQMIHNKLKTSLEFSSKEKVWLKPWYDSTPNRKNQIVTAFASSGAGKSWGINDLLMRNPAILDNETVPAVVLFSSVGSEDPSYAGIRNWMGEKFFWKDPRDLEATDLQMSHYEKKSVLVFDDVSSISDKHVRDRVIAFRDNCLEVARHKSLVIISSSHLMHDRTRTQKLRNSSAYFLLYPRNSVKPILDCLENLFAMGRHQRNDLVKKLKREGRMQFLRCDTPSYLINEKRVQLL